jgi:hypothetical protein
MRPDKAGLPQILKQTGHAFMILATCIMLAASSFSWLMNTLFGLAGGALLLGFGHRAKSPAAESGGGVLILIFLAISALEIRSAGREIRTTNTPSD